MPSSLFTCICALAKKSCVTVFSCLVAHTVFVCLFVCFAHTVEKKRKCLFFPLNPTNFSNIHRTFFLFGVVNLYGACWPHPSTFIKIIFNLHPDFPDFSSIIRPSPYKVLWCWHQWIWNWWLSPQQLHSCWCQPAAPWFFSWYSGRVYYPGTIPPGHWSLPRWLFLHHQRSSPQLTVNISKVYLLSHSTSHQLVWWEQFWYTWLIHGQSPWNKTQNPSEKVHSLV